MSDVISKTRAFRQSEILTSVAALALIASVGGSIVNMSTSANAAAPSAADLQTAVAPSFAPIVERVKPAVVSVKVKIENAAQRSDEGSGWQREIPPEFRDFFKRFGEPKRLAPTPENPEQAIGQGSGFFVSTDGYVVTNYHVVGSARSVSITMDNGKVLDARVIGTDAKTDLAVLKVNEKGDYPHVSFAKDAPRVGDWVVAIGNPFGLGGTVTAGIVSADGRDIGEGPYDSFLQIDAPINKGNSGGPSFNLMGEVVGVNTAIMSPAEGSVGVGFAIPARTVETVVDSLEHDGVVSRGFLGVRIQPVSEDVAAGLGLKNAAGALIDQVEPETPSAEAGLKSGDVITKFNGQNVKDAADLTRRVGALKPGDKAELVYVRDGKEKSVELALGSQNGVKNVMASNSDTDGAVLGIEVASAKQVSGAGDQGVVVVNVHPNGPAASKGLQNGDIILEVSGKPVSDPNDLKAGIASARRDAKKAVLLMVKNADGSHFVAIALPKA
jgi:serine protease Do